MEAGQQIINGVLEKIEKVFGIKPNQLEYQGYFINAHIWKVKVFKLDPRKLIDEIEIIKMPEDECVVLEHGSLQVDVYFDSVYIGFFFE
jgi:hypothetical protein